MKQHYDKADIRLQRHIRQGKHEKKLDEILRKEPKAEKDWAYIEAVRRRDARLQQKLDKGLV